MIKVFIAMVFGLLPNGQVNIVWSSKPFETLESCQQFQNKEAPEIVKEAIENGIRPWVKCEAVDFPEITETNEKGPN